MHTSKILIGLTVLLASQTSLGFELRGDGALGYDSNPFRLSDDLSPDEGGYLDFKLRAKQDFNNGFLLRAGIKSRHYESSLSDADQYLLNIGAQYKHETLINDKKAQLLIDGGYSVKDKTYVSRFTGEVGTFGGQDISDRYDYDSWDAKGKFSIMLNEHVGTGLALKYRSRDYEDFDIDGLSNLDYDQLFVSNDWTYKQSQKSKFALSLYLGKREYDDKREKDLNGNEIPASDLTYDYYGAEISQRYKVSPDLRVKWELKYQDRQDSGSGYYDMDEFVADIDLRYRVSNNWNLVTSALYIDRNYPVRITIADENDIQSPDKQGYALKLRAERELPSLSDYNANAYLGVIYEDYDSDEPAYIYDRYQIMAGLKARF